MKSKCLSIILLLVLLTAAPSVVMATTLIDTGPGINTVGGWGLWLDDSNHYEWLAAEFSLSQPSKITSVEGWMGNYTGDAPLKVVIYTNGRGIPGEVLYSQIVNVPGRLTYPGWVGPSNLENWYLEAGTYWVAFEAQTGLHGYMPPCLFGNPLKNEALSWYNDIGDPEGYQPTDLNLGVRISGDINAVPLPPSAFLLGSGLLGLVGWRRLRKG